MKSYSKPFTKTLQLEFDSMLLAGSGGSANAGQFTPGGSSSGSGGVSHHRQLSSILLWKKTMIRMDFNPRFPLLTPRLLRH